MAEIIEVRVPDIGDVDAVDLVEVLVAPGDAVEADQGLITLESDKASMDVPSPRAGTVRELKVAVGDKVAADSLILTLVVAEPPAPAAAPAVRTTGESEPRADVVVVGSGPGGYSAAFRAADLGKRVVLVERYPTLGGVCLNVGCIPSKALLHMAKLIEDATDAARHGVTFGEPAVDLAGLRAWKDGIVGRLTGGISSLAGRRKVEVVHGEGRFESPRALRVDTAGGVRRIPFDQAIVAVGSRPIELPGFPVDDPRLMDSTAALELAEVPRRLLVIGGGIIGLEMATVYDALGAKITVVELLDRLIPGCDRDVVKPLHKRLEVRYENIFLETRVSRIEARAEGLEAFFEGKDGAQAADLFDRVLLAVGRRPNGHHVGAEAAGVRVDERGFIPVDRQMRTNVPHIFAIGDVAGEPMLAHKAVHEGHVAAEVAADEKSSFDARAIPSVAFTDPEVAWVGLTEEQAKQQGRRVEKGIFPWSASGRSLALGREEGRTKLLFDADTRRILGAGIVGPGAGELIAEVTLAIEMGCEAADVGLTIHPHPTLSETVGFSAEAVEGTLTDLYLPRRKR